METKSGLRRATVVAAGILVAMAGGAYAQAPMSTYQMPPIGQAPAPQSAPPFSAPPEGPMPSYNAPEPPPPPAPMGPAMAGPMPPALAGEADAINHCLCLQQEVDALRGQMDAQRGDLTQRRDELSRLDAEVDQQRGQVDVNDPQSIARFKALLARRDRAAERSTGQTFSSAREAVQRYNSRVDAYNRECANREFNAILMSQMRATLSCSRY